MKLAVLLTILTILYATEVQSVQWKGGCGSKLVDTLRHTCGERGFNSPKWELFKRLHQRPSRSRRRGRHSLRRRRRHMAVFESRLIAASRVTYADASQQQSKAVGLLEHIIRKSSHNVARRGRRRLRRNIHRSCCQNDCSLEEARRLVCRTS